MHIYIYMYINNKNNNNNSLRDAVAAVAPQEPYVSHYTCMFDHPKYCPNP